MTIQAGYEWLLEEPGPKELLEAIKLLGTHEVLGPRNNPTIMEWAEETHTTYPGDATAWCGLGRSIVAKRAGWPYHPQGNALWALNWAMWEAAREGGHPMLGDTMVKRRKGGGHVTMYVGEDDPKLLAKGQVLSYHCMGANQDDAFNIERIPKSADWVAFRHPIWHVAQPPNVRRVFLSPHGTPTVTTEA